MSDEVDDYIQVCGLSIDTDFDENGFRIPGHIQVYQTNNPIDDAYWHATAVPCGSNNEVEIIRQSVYSDAYSNRFLYIVVRNNTANPTVFTSGLVRIPTTD